MSWDRQILAKKTLKVVNAMESRIGKDSGSVILFGLMYLLLSIKHDFNLRRKKKRSDHLLNFPKSKKEVGVERHVVVL